MQPPVAGSDGAAVVGAGGQWAHSAGARSGGAPCTPSAERGYLPCFGQESGLGAGNRPFP